MIRAGQAKASSQGLKHLGHLSLFFQVLHQEAGSEVEQTGLLTFTYLGCWHYSELSSYATTLTPGCEDLKCYLKQLYCFFFFK